jgi:hypothetical protein
MENGKHDQVAHVTIGVDDQAPQQRDIPEGDTAVSTLKSELGVDGAAVLYLKQGNRRKPLDNSQSLDVEDGMHFEAIGGGGVS